MKKILLFLFVIFLFSCSKNDDNSSAVSLKNTIKRITETTYYTVGSSDVNSASFNYENGKLKNIVDEANGYVGEYVYSGDKIISYNFYQNSSLVSSYTINYTQDNLAEIITDESKTTFGYNNGKVVTKKYFNDPTGAASSLLEQDSYTYSGNNVATLIKMTNYAGTTSYSKWGYDYDTKNDILKNMNPYLKYIFEFESTVGFSENNAIISYKYDSVNSTNKAQDYTYQITYNSDNFPTNIKKFSTSSNGTIVRLISDLVVEYN